MTLESLCALLMRVQRLNEVIANLVNEGTLDDGAAAAVLGVQNQLDVLLFIVEAEIEEFNPENE